MSSVPRTCRMATLLTMLLGALPALAAEPVYDPMESINRAVFRFNDTVDEYALEPVARGWHWVMPDRVELCINNFFGNLRAPIVSVNNLLQGKVTDAGSDVGRFLVNTTIGLVGLFDPATDFGLVEHEEDFGQTLGVWGVPPGPYLVVPLWGPSNLRDGSGQIAESFATVYAWYIPWYYTTGAQAVRIVNARAQVLSEVEQIKEASFDLYAAARDGYAQRRRVLIQDGIEMSEEEQDDLYNIEE